MKAKTFPEFPLTLVSHSSTSFSRVKSKEKERSKNGRNCSALNSKSSSAERSVTAEDRRITRSSPGSINPSTCIKTKVKFKRQVSSYFSANLIYRFVNQWSQVHRKLNPNPFPQKPDNSSPQNAVIALFHA